MRDLCVKQAWPRGNGLTCPPQPWPLAVLVATALFIPALLIGRVTWAGSAHDYKENRKFWADWHAKYDRYKTSDRTHALNSVSLPSEYNGYSRAECTCHFSVIRAKDDATLLAEFQKHLDASEPVTVDLGQAPE